MRRSNSSSESSSRAKPSDSRSSAASRARRSARCRGWASPSSGIGGVTLPAFGGARSLRTHPGASAFPRSTSRARDLPCGVEQRSARDGCEDVVRLARWVSCELVAKRHRQHVHGARSSRLASAANAAALCPPLVPRNLAGPFLLRRFRKHAAGWRDLETLSIADEACNTGTGSMPSRPFEPRPTGLSFGAVWAGLFAVSVTALSCAKLLGDIQVEADP